MTDATATPPRTPRRSLTKTQLETPAGAELLALCQRITEDGRVSEAELTDLRDWLNRHRGSGLPAEEFLTSTVERILAHERITPDDLADVHKALESVLPPDLRASAQRSRRTVEAEERQHEREETAEEKERAAAESRRNAPVEYYDFMVAGISHEGRADVVRSLLSDDFAEATVYLVRDRANKHSRNAVEVRLADGRCIGYVPEWERETRARDVARHLDAGARHKAWIKKLYTGGHYPGVVVVAEIYEAQATAAGAVAQSEVAEIQQTPLVATRPAARVSVGRVILAVVLVAVAGLVVLELYFSWTAERDAAVLRSRLQAEQTARDRGMDEMRAAAAPLLAAIQARGNRSCLLVDAFTKSAAGGEIRCQNGDRYRVELPANKTGKPKVVRLR